MDGWRNVHNKLISVLTLSVDGNIYSTDCVDIAELGHTAEYLAKPSESNAEKIIKKCGCSVLWRMQKWKRHKEKVKKSSYGCSAHFLNLLSQDMQIKNKKEHITEIVKFFSRNRYIRASLYKAAGGTMLVMPAQARWNTIPDSIESYLKNWDIW